MRHDILILILIVLDFGCIFVLLVFEYSATFLQALTTLNLFVFVVLIIINTPPYFEIKAPTRHIVLCGKPLFASFDVQVSNFIYCAQ